MFGHRGTRTLIQLLQWMAENSGDVDRKSISLSSHEKLDSFPAVMYDILANAPHLTLFVLVANHMQFVHNC